MRCVADKCVVPAMPVAAPGDSMCVPVGTPRSMPPCAIFCMIGIGARTYDFMKSVSIAFAFAISRSAISGVRKVRAKL